VAGSDFRLLRRRPYLTSDYPVYHPEATAMADRQINRICVFCGTNTGSRPEYGAAARELGRLLAEEGIELVYGGASVRTRSRSTEDTSPASSPSS
jgi:hypothetical protein